MGDRSLLTPAEEARHLQRLVSRPRENEALRLLSGQFQVLQARSQLLVSLVTITLTITGFSGPKIAESNVYSRVFLALGLTFSLAAAIILLMGILRLSWVTRDNPEPFGKLLERIILRRNLKTRYYRAGLLCLVFGLGFYTTAVILYLAFGGR